MNGQVQNAIAPETYSKFEADNAAYVAHCEQLRTGNKATLFAALAAAKITEVTVIFDGYGDSGQIEDVTAMSGETVVPLPNDIIKLLVARWGEALAIESEMSLASAVEALAYDCLGQSHCGWENNDGAYGTFTFNVAAKTITLEFNERYTDIETYQHSF